MPPVERRSPSAPPMSHQDAVVQHLDRQLVDRVRTAVGRAASAGRSSASVASASTATVPSRAVPTTSRPLDAAPLARRRRSTLEAEWPGPRPAPRPPSCSPTPIRCTAARCARWSPASCSARCPARGRRRAALQLPWRRAAPRAPTATGVAERLDIVAAIDALRRRRAPALAARARRLVVRRRRVACGRRRPARRLVRWSPRRCASCRSTQMLAARRPPAEAAGRRPSTTSSARPTRRAATADWANTTIDGGRRRPTTSSPAAPARSPTARRLRRRRVRRPADHAELDQPARTVTPGGGQAPWPRRWCARRSGRSTRPARRRRGPRSRPSTRWSSVPTPPEAITGMVTASATARVSGRSKPSRVPSRSIDVSRISPAPERLDPARPPDRVECRSGVRPPWVYTS